MARAAAIFSLLVASHASAHQHLKGTAHAHGPLDANLQLSYNDNAPALLNEPRADGAEARFMPTGDGSTADHVTEPAVEYFGGALLARTSMCFVCPFL